MPPVTPRATFMVFPRRKALVSQPQHSKDIRYESLCGPLRACTAQPSGGEVFSCPLMRRVRKPDPELRQPVRRRYGFQEFPTSPCPRESRPARCGKVCASWFEPPAVLRIAVALRAGRRPECSDSCCRSLRSISWTLSPLITGCKILIAESY